MFRNLIFDGISLKTYGLYISGDAVYDSPERDVEMISIPGRNGTFALDKGRFNNIEVTYPAGVFSDSQTNFADKVSALRNQLASRTGYRRIEDEYHPDEYRMGVYRRGLEFDPVHYNEASEFDITFDCKPQRFLKTGDEPVTLGEWGETETKSGSIVSFDETGATAIKSLKVNIVPKQSGSGDPSPSNVRPISGWDSVGVTRAGKNLLNLPTYEEFITCPLVGNYYSYAIKVKPNTSYYLSVSYTDGYDPSGKYVYLLLTNNASGNNPWVAVAHHSGNSGGAITSSADGYLYLRLSKGDSTYVHYPNIRSHAQAQLEEGTSATAYEPYNGSTITTNLPQTVYGGVLDVVSGKLTINKRGYIWDGSSDENWNVSSGRAFIGVSNPLPSGSYSWDFISNYLKPTGSPSSNPSAWQANINNTGNLLIGIPTTIADVSAWKTYLSNNNLQFVYTATPTEIQLTPTEVKSLLGANNIWADAGTIEVEVGENPNVLVNPTLFESKPLLMVEGYGDINIDDQVISIDNVVIGDVLLSNGARLEDTTTGTLADMVTVGVAEFDQAKVNTGDTITLKPTAYTINIAYNNLLPSEHVEAEVTNQSGVGESSGGALSRTTASYTVNMPAVLFTVGTSASVQHSASWIFRSVSIYGDCSETTFPMVFNIAYDGANKITITAKHWYQAGATVQTTGTAGDLTGYSTVLVDGTIYIDLDIGEAYWIKDGTVISANYTVHLGADLPTLKPGINNITYTTRITSLKIVPRWWKV